MIKKNLFNRYITDLLNSVEQNLLNYSKDRLPENLHHLRVDLKKLNAILSFSENVYQKRYDANALKPLFDAAGKIREIQISMQVLVSILHPSKKLLTQLNKKENNLSGKFIQNTSKYIRQIKKFRENISLPEKLPGLKIIKKYFKTEIQKACKKAETKNRKDLHQYRRKIKKLMCIYQFLPKNIQKKLVFDESEIDTLQKKLGDWHDIYATLNFLAMEHLSKKTEKNILKLKSKEKRKFHSFFKNI